MWHARGSAKKGNRVAGTGPGAIFRGRPKGKETQGLQLCSSLGQFFRPLSPAPSPSSTTTSVSLLLFAIFSPFLSSSLWVADNGLAGYGATCLFLVRPLYFFRLRVRPGIARPSWQLLYTPFPPFPLTSRGNLPLSNTHRPTTTRSVIKAQRPSSWTWKLSTRV